MLRVDDLKDLLGQPSLPKTDKILLCLAVGATTPKSVKQIRAIAASGGLRTAKNWNISALLAGSAGGGVRGDAGWELTQLGRAFVTTAAPKIAQQPPAAIPLRDALTKIVDPDSADFVREAIECVERRLYRAAVVLSWVGALSRIYDHVVKTALPAFNAEATKRNSKWKAASTRDDLARMQEADFLDVLAAISILGKNVKEELKQRLNLRNACGHPNSFKLGESAVAHHIEVLALNVFAKF